VVTASCLPTGDPRAHPASPARLGPLPTTSHDDDQVQVDPPPAQHGLRYYLFTGGCVTYRLAFSRQSAPALFDQADQFLGFTTRSRYVNGVRNKQGLTLCGAGAPPCSG